MTVHRDYANKSCPGDYLYNYKPYAKMGANGSAKRVMQEVDKLPIRKTKYIEPINITETI